MTRLRVPPCLRRPLRLLAFKFDLTLEAAWSLVINAALDKEEVAN